MTGSPGTACATARACAKIRSAPGFRKNGGSTIRQSAPAFCASWAKAIAGVVAWRVSETITGTPCLCASSIVTRIISRCSASSSL